MSHLSLAVHATLDHPLVHAVLAASTDDDTGGGENRKAGPLGLAIILLLAVACYFLFRSMSRRLRRVRENFPVDQSGEPPAPTRPRPGPADSEPAVASITSAPARPTPTAPLPAGGADPAEAAASDPATDPPD
jgi:hypothetical protein